MSSETFLCSVSTAGTRRAVAALSARDWEGYDMNDDSLPPVGVP